MATNAAKPRQLTEEEFEQLKECTLPWDNTTTLGTYFDFLQLESRQYGRLLAAIPPCPEHGYGCYTHALHWITHKKGTEDGNQS